MHLSWFAMAAEGGGGSGDGNESSLCDIGVYGLATMGQNLALNIAEHGFKCAVCNRSPSKVRCMGARGTVWVACWSGRRISWRTVRTSRRRAPSHAGG
jgi:hypothetical protein